MWCLRLWAWMPCRTLIPQLLVPCAWQTWAYEGLQTWHWRERERVKNNQYYSNMLFIASSRCCEFWGLRAFCVLCLRKHLQIGLRWPSPCELVHLCCVLHSGHSKDTPLMQSGLTSQSAVWALGALAFDEDIGRNLATMAINGYIFLYIYMYIYIYILYIYYIYIFNRKIMLQTPFVRFHDKFRAVSSEEWTKKHGKVIGTSIWETDKISGRLQ